MLYILSCPAAVEFLIDLSMSNFFCGVNEGGWLLSTLKFFYAPNDFPFVLVCGSFLRNGTLGGCTDL